MAHGLCAPSSISSHRRGGADDGEIPSAVFFILSSSSSPSSSTFAFLWSSILFFFRSTSALKQNTLIVLHAAVNPACSPLGESTRERNALSTSIRLAGSNQNEPIGLFSTRFLPLGAT